MPKRTEAQRRADKAYKEKNKANQRENFANIAATFRKNEKEYIAAVFSAHGVKPAEVIRGAAAALVDGEPVRLAREPLTLPPAAAPAEKPPQD